jgi:hypothetical protein
MSSPAKSTFCSSGHLVENVLEGCFSPIVVTKCPYCKSTNFYTVISWHDREPETCIIPHDPIGFDWVRVWTDTIHGEIKVQRYNVSKVQEWIDRKTNNIIQM